MTRVLPTKNATTFETAKDTKLAVYTHSQSFMFVTIQERRLANFRLSMVAFLISDNKNRTSI